MSESVDDQLMTFVNALGTVVFISIVIYHFVTSSKSDS